MSYLSPTIKKEKLLSFLSNVLHDPVHGPSVHTLLERLHISQKQLTDVFLEYNMDVYTHGNEIYGDKAIHLVLYIHNLIENSWHIKRQEKMVSLLNSIPVHSVLDLGFGSPSLYVKNCAVNKHHQLTLCDFAPNAIEFAKEVISLWAPEGAPHISFLHQDINEIYKQIPTYDTLIALHSLEHTPNPTQSLKELVEHAKPHTHFILELPVGPLTPEHFMEWSSGEEVKHWLESSSLTILKSHEIFVNPEVDLFAEVHQYQYGGYLALCKKE